MKKVNSDKIDKNCVSLWPSTKLFTAQCRSADQGLEIPAVEYLYFSVLIFFYNPWMCVQTKYLRFSLFVNNFMSCLQWFAICPQWHHLSDPPNCRGCNPQWTFIYPLFSSTLTVFYYTRPRKYISRDEQTDSPPCLPHPFLTPHCPPPSSPRPEWEQHITVLYLPGQHHMPNQLVGWGQSVHSVDDNIIGFLSLRSTRLSL